MELEKLVWRTEPRRVGDIRPLEYNPRKVTEEGKAKMAASLDEFNLVEIPAINADNIIIAGHRRWERLMECGREDDIIDVRVPNRLLSESEVKKYNVISNTHVGIWDVRILEEVFSKEIDLGSLGVDLAALKKAEWKEIRESGQDEFDDTPPVDPKTVLGDIWELESPKIGIIHRIVCGDSTEADVVQKALFGRKTPILMVTDPPYGVNYDPMWREKALGGDVKNNGKVANDNRFRWPETYALSPGDIAYVWHAGKYACEVGEDLQKSGFEIQYQIIWNKTNGAIGRGDYHWKHEPCWYAVKKGKKHNWQGFRDQWSVWEIQNLSNRAVILAEGQTGHGTQKPLECMARPIRNNTSVGDGIYDPFLGSGTSLIAAEQLQRSCTGIELSPNYVDVDVRRWVLHMRKQGLTYLVRLNGEPVSPEILDKICLTQPA